MPNNQLSTERQRDLDKIKTLTEQSEYFEPKNLSLSKNEQFASYGEYNLEEASENVKFIDRMLFDEENGTIEITEEDRAALKLQKNREKNFLMLNAGKFIGDSKEMQAVKMHVEAVESLLRDAVNMEPYVLAIIEKQYENAIVACQYYVDNKNPWFAAGQKRYDMVKETLERMTAEKAAFMEAKVNYEKGYYGETIENPWQLLKKKLADDEVYKDNKKKYEACSEDETQVNNAWMLDMKSARGFDAFYADAKQKDDSITEADANYIFFNRLFREFQEYDKKTSGEPQPMCSDFGKASELEDYGVEAGVAKKGDFSRRIAPGMRFVRRDKDGNPLNPAEAEKAQKNEQWLDAYRKYYEAKAAKNNPGDKPIEEAAAAYESARKALWEQLKVYLDDMQKELFVLSPEDLKKDRDFLARLLMRDIGKAKGYYDVAGLWSEMKKEDLADYMDNYTMDNPQFLGWLDMITAMKGVDMECMYYEHKCDTNLEVAPHKNYLKKYQDKMKDPAATDEDKQLAKENYEEQLRMIEESVNQFAGEYEKSMDMYRQAAHFNAGEARAAAFKGMYQSGAFSIYAENLVEDQKRKGVIVPKAAAEAQLILKNAKGYQNMPEYKALEKEFHDKNINGEMSRKVGFNLKYVLTKPGMKERVPASKEDQEKEEWNKKWLSCFSGEGNQQQKLKMMEEGIMEILNANIPTPQQIEEHGFAYYFDKDPVFFAELASRVTALDNIKGSGDDELALYNQIVANDPVNKAKHNMLNAFCSYAMIYLRHKYQLDQGEGFDFKAKRKYDEYLDNKAMHDQLRVENFKNFKKFYMEVAAKEADEKWRKANFTEEKIQEAAQKKKRNQTNPDLQRAHAQRDMQLLLFNKQQNADISALGVKGENVLQRYANCVDQYCAGYYYVKRDANGAPVTAEEAKKAVHNEKWKQLWEQYLDAQVLKVGDSKAKQERQKENAARGIMLLYEEHIAYLLVQPMPAPGEVDTKEKLENYYNNDVFVKADMNHLRSYYYNVMNAFFPRDMALMDEKYPEFKLARVMWDALHAGNVEGYKKAYDEFKKVQMGL